MALQIVPSIDLRGGRIVRLKQGDYARQVSYDVDPLATARAFGARTTWVDLALLALIAVAIVIGVRSLGNLLVIALLVGPAATARLFARRMPQLMLAAVLAAIAASLGGLYLSYYTSLAAGASVAIVTVALYVAARAQSVLAAAP